MAPDPRDVYNERMGVTTAPVLVTEDEFLSLPESNQKQELVDGEVIVAPSPTWWHQEVLSRIVELLRAWAARQDTPCTIGQAPVDIRFAPGRVLQPDAFVLLSAVDRDHQGPLDRVPELCIEVLSANRMYDRITKRVIYAESGVTEYWIVDPAGSLERWSGPGLTQHESVDGMLATDMLPGFELAVSALFT